MASSRTAVKQQTKDAHSRKVALGGTIGNAAEWYDYSIFGFSAAYLGAAFFPSDNPTTSLLASFATFAVTFLFRPLGGVFFGALADRMGRQRTLVIVVVGISAATTLVGLLPTHASIGVAAPILLVLLRIIQGLSAGGEIGTSLSFLAEHAPPERRGSICASLNIGAYIGGLMASGTFALFSVTLGAEDMQSWGWRIPFLLGAPLGIAAYYIRSRLTETPDFEALQAEQATSESPIAEVFRTSHRAMLLCFLITMTHNMAFYAIFVYYPNALSAAGGGRSTYAYLIAPVTYVAALIALPIAADLSDRVGRKPVLIAACGSYLVLGLPAAFLFTHGTLWATVTGALVFGAVLGTYSGAPFAAMAELFTARTRTTGFSISYNVSAAIFGGLAPLYLTFLVDATDSFLIPVVCVMSASVITIVATRSMPDHAGKPLRIR
ncbi:MFS transporter [Nocardia sp. NPDC058518]|uniref:MFS transporter n=1 Tax=Nocardia sp. NPDC058518 TaxID=3346534 RepID=UPI003652CAB1